jgi:hypothetical protein
MAITTYSAAPYSDDFSQDKNYLRILFRPGRSVQVRELNQLQSNVQDQIDKFGRHIFKDGDRVLDGYTNYDSSIQSIGVVWENSDVVLEPSELTALKGKEIYSGTAWRAKILSAINITGGQRLYIKLVGQAGTFADENDVHIDLESGEAALSIGGQSYGDTAKIAEIDTGVEAPGYHGGVFQDAGVFFVKGHFVHADATEAFYTKTSSTAQLTGVALFDIVETVVESTTDNSLLDNANGEPNANAPGADRYKISLNLSFVPVSDTSVEANQQRINLIDIKDDKVVQPARTQYSELGKALAQRTEEESGSYVVNPFKYDVREYLNDSAGNRGRYTAAEIFNSGGDPLLPSVTDTATAATEGAKRYVIGVEPGIAYVQGYRVELESKQDVVADKGRQDSDTSTKTNYKFSANLGQYIEGALVDLVGELDSNTIDSLEFSPNLTYDLYDTSPAKIGECRIHAIENTGTKTLNGTDAPDSTKATKHLYIYDINLNAGKTIKNAVSITLDPSATSITNATIFTNSSGFELKEIGDNSSRMIYPLGNYDIKTVNSSGATCVVQKRYSNTATTAVAGEVKITAAGSDSFVSTDPDDYVVLQTEAGADSAAGETYVSDVSIAGSTATLKLLRANNTTPLISSSKAITVFAPTQTALSLKTKTSATGTKSIAALRIDPGDIIQFDKVDAYEITTFVHNGVTIPASDYELITGQTDTHYGYSQVVYRGDSSLYQNSSSTNTITFKYYNHTGSGNVFGRDSYSGDLEDAPTYEELKLANCLDFRLPITHSTEGSTIKPDSIVNVGFTHYNKRKDIVVLNQLGDAQFIQGSPSASPVYPQTPADAILLYRIEKPGYLYTLGDLKIERIENRRYSMRDIGSLESRIQNLEYYASLSQLESEAANTQITDSAGPRFKGGILTDSFRGHGVGDVSSPGYKAAIDRENFTARPTYLSDNARWSYISGMGLNAQSVTSWNGASVPSTTSYSGKRKNSLTLDFIEKVLVDQPFASDHISVNPYDVATWSGSLELSPSSDEWKDVNYVPDIINNIEGDNSALLKQIANNPNVLGTEWNEWEAQWKSKKVRHGRWFMAKTSSIQVADTFTETTWTSRRRGNQKEFLRQNREGIQTSLVENTEREVIGDDLLNITFVPFIRSRKVYFRGRMLKPNTTFNLFFDDVNITSYAKEATFEQFGGGVAGVGGTDVARYEGLTTGFGADGSITTDSAGDVDGWFVIPNNNSLRFRTGSRQVRLTDRSDNNRTLELSSAESTYHAKGLLETRQKTILSTRQIVLERTRLKESRNLLIGEKVVRRDPIAQTFMIGNEPTGIFLSSVDIFFQKKDPNLPVELSIVSVENGIPTQNTIPFSKVIKLSAAVAVSSNASSETKFMFDTPVYLQPGVEYAIVLISNSARYRVWHAEVGGTDVGTNAEKINKNVNLGVMLKSQNASTWTPDQNKDLKFTLNRADFKTSTTNAIFTGLSPQRQQVTYVNITSGGSGYLSGSPSVTFTGGSGSGATAKAHVGKGGVIDHIEVITNGSGYTGVPTVAVVDQGISIHADVFNTTDGGVDFANNKIYLPAGGLEAKNGQAFTYKTNGGSTITGLTNDTAYYVKTVDSDGNEVPYSRIIELYTSSAFTTQATFTNRGGKQQTLITATAATATASVDTWKASSYLPIIQDMLLPESNVTYALEVKENESHSVFPGEVLYTSERVTHDSTSAYDGTGANRLKLTSSLSTTDSRISPVVDLDRISLVTFDNIVNNSSEFEGTRDDGQCAARYITKSIKLESPADQINIYADAMRPDSSTSIEVYAKFNTLNSTTPFDSLGWTKINLKDGSKIPVSTNFEFGEVEFEGSSADEFNQVAVKILFKSSDKAFVPEIRNLRVIATL